MAKRRTPAPIDDLDAARKRAISKKTKFATNGEVVIKFGFYCPSADHPEKDRSGTFYACTCYPPNSVRNLYKGGSGDIPEVWIVGKDAFYKKFIAIEEHLLAPHVLEVLNTPLK